MNGFRDLFAWVLGWKSKPTVGVGNFPIQSEVVDLLYTQAESINVQYLQKLRVNIHYTQSAVVDDQG